MYISEIRKEKRDRLLILTDEVGCFPLNEKEAAEYHIEEDSVLPDADWKRICDEILKPRVLRRAMYLLQRMDRTEFQLRQRLSQDHYPDFLINGAMDDLKSFHYVDDLRYASSYIRFHQSQKSRQQLRIGLQRRGVPVLLIEQALEEDYEENENELIRRLLEKKQYDPDSTDRGQKYRIYQSLLRKGFQISRIKRQMDLT